jgi:hypothetical protein
MTAAIDDAELAALADGELTLDAAARLEAEVAADPALAARLERIRALRRAIAAAYADTLEETPPDRLQSVIRAEASVIDLAAARRRRIPSVVRWGGLAASLALAFLAGRALIPASGAGDIAAGPRGGLMAQGALASALQDQLASNQPPGAPVQIGVSFRTADGSFCRTFTLRGAQAVAGLACREDAGWRVRIAADSQSPAPVGGYRTAADETPAPVLETMDQLIRGEPLDAAAESGARAAGWKAR